MTSSLFFRMKETTFETMRLIAVLFTVVLKLILMPTYLQSYLNIAYQRVEEQKKEAGRITNVELQKRISSIFYYLCVVTLQYVAPIIMCLYLTLMYKTLGGYTWTGFLEGAVQLDECSAELEGTEINGQNLNYAVADDRDDRNILETVQTFQLSLQSLKSVFTTEVYRGLFGFATWWSCCCLFAATSLGMIYQSYFTKS